MNNFELALTCIVMLTMTFFAILLDERRGGE